MAEFKEFAKQFNRMCDAMPDCDKCPVSRIRGILTCWRACFEEPEKMEQVVMDWAEKHPVKTNCQKFEEVFGCNPYLLNIFKANSIEWLDEEYKEPKNE